MQKFKSSTQLKLVDPVPSLLVLLFLVEEEVLFSLVNLHDCIRIWINIRMFFQAMILEVILPYLGDASINRTLVESIGASVGSPVEHLGSSIGKEGLQYRDIPDTKFLNRGIICIFPRDSHSYQYEPWGGCTFFLENLKLQVGINTNLGWWCEFFRILPKYAE